jgi:chemotaxis protein MotB
MSGGDDGLPEEHEEHVNHEAWVIPYADLLTLLMAMFIALFAMSSVDMTKFRQLAVGFNEALGGGKLESGIGGSGKATSPVVGEGNGEGPLTGGTLLPSDSSMTSKQLQSLLDNIATKESANASERRSLEEVRQGIEAAARSLGLGGKVQTRIREDGIEVTLLTDEVLFGSARADVQEAGFELLDRIAAVLAAIENPLIITGFTDSDPIATARFPSNDELSFSRALSVQRYLSAHGVDPQRIRTAGRGAQNPIAPNDTAENKARNRRVEIIVESNQVRKVLEENNLTDREVTTPTTRPIDQPVERVGGTGDPSVEPDLGVHGP